MEQEVRRFEVLGEDDRKYTIVESVKVIDTSTQYGADSAIGRLSALRTLEGYDVSPDKTAVNAYIILAPCGAVRAFAR